MLTKAVDAALVLLSPIVCVPTMGFERVGAVPKTRAPLPVSSVTAVARFEEDGVARNVATPVASPDIPVETGNPVQFVNVPEVGVPKRGVTNVGDVAKTAAPLPVSSVRAVDKFAELKDPKEVAFPTEVMAPIRLAFVVTFPAVNPEAVPVIFVPTSADGVPRAGVTSVGLVANTAAPLPVSSVNAPERLADVNDPRLVALPTEVTAPVKFAFVVTLPAVRPAAVPVILVPTKAVGVSKFGLVNVGDVARTIAPDPVVPLLKLAADI